MGRRYVLFSLLSLALILVVSKLSSAELNRVTDSQITAMPSSAPVVLLNFWATWCKPCQSEIPTLNRLQKKYPSARFIGINVDEIENAGAIPGFLKKHPFDYTVVMRDGSNFKAMAESVDPGWEGGLPATFIFLRGKRIFSHYGMIDEKNLDTTLQQTVNGM
jgi:thiol-disulfide isomerase/thioredoxin